VGPTLAMDEGQDRAKVNKTYTPDEIIIATPSWGWGGGWARSVGEVPGMDGIFVVGVDGGRVDGHTVGGVWGGLQF
jgi:hypothetical protein